MYNPPLQASSAVCGQDFDSCCRYLPSLKDTTKYIKIKTEIKNQIT